MSKLKQELNGILMLLATILFKITLKSIIHYVKKRRQQDKEHPSIFYLSTDTCFFHELAIGGAGGL